MPGLDFLNIRLKKVFGFLIELAAGNLSKREEISEQRDDIDAILSGINMLAEELEVTTISNEHLKSIFEGIFDLVVVLNLRGQIKTVNSSVGHLLGYSADELQGSSCNCFLPEKSGYTFQKIRNKLNSYLDQVQFDIEVPSKSGRLIPMNCSFSIIQEKGKKKGILLIMKDITNQVRTQKELKSRNHELNSFIYRASHDMRGPMASMQGLINLAKMELQNPDTAAGYIQLLDRSLFKLSKTVNELLDFGRLSVEDVRYNPFSPEELLQEVLKEFSNKEDFDKIQFRVRVNYKHTLNSEKNILKSILINLIDNSIKYRNHLANPSKINIHMASTGSGLSVSLKDNGQGIPKDAQNKVFNMFYRANAQSSGSGLGLYIVKSGIEKLGGNITLKSKVNQGTFISFYIPDH